MTADPETQPLRIVIADDQTVVREGLEMVRRDADLEVVATVADGEQALGAVAEHRPDAILLDLHMPVLDGVGATERIAGTIPRWRSSCSPPSPKTRRSSPP